MSNLNASDIENKTYGITPSLIKNKIKRSIVYNKQKWEKKKDKRKLKTKRRKETDALGEEAPPKKVPHTLETTRQYDETIVSPEDYEALHDEEIDEFADYFRGEKVPHLAVTTCVHPSSPCLAFVEELIDVFPNSHYYKRGTYSLKQIISFCSNRDFTDLLVINENRKRPNGVLMIHLPDGPTAHFKLSSIVPSKSIKGHGKASGCNPELILNNFNTRLGHTVGRMLASLFPYKPNFKGRSAVTFHNQRDYIFFRRHRYIFEQNEKVRLQELGPRFTLKLRSLQHGTFDSKGGEYEWVHKPEMDANRRRFYL